MSTASVLRPSVAALRSRLALQILPSVMITIAISQWTIAVLGKTNAPTTLITFAWAAVTGHRLVTSRRAEQQQKFHWSVDQILGALGGQIVWLVLPWVQHAHPDAWYSLPLTVAPILAGCGAVVAVCWPLRLVVASAHVRKAAARHSEIDALVLYGSFFLMSGNLIFAASAYMSVVALFAKAQDWRDLLAATRVGWPHPFRSVVLQHEATSPFGG
jgi:hypothetical protein